MARGGPPRAQLLRQTLAGRGVRRARLSQAASGNQTAPALEQQQEPVVPDFPTDQEGGV